MQTSGISILGCGWLGLPLANFLIRKGFQVYGSTTSKEKLAILRQNNIRAFELLLNPNAMGNDWYDFLENPTLIINIPPKIQEFGQDFHVKQIENLLRLVVKSNVRRIFYISSTSVYPEKNQVVCENSEVLSEHTLVKAENLLLSLPQIQIMILRCGGLMGENRIAGKSLAGKKTNTGSMPVNFIHREDVIRIIFQLLAKKVEKEIFNIVAPLHPTRQEVYAAQAQKYNFAKPIFEKADLPYKIVDSSKIQNFLNYEFLFPNPAEF
ncbi:MAG: SDR family NAD(P)-dependent oxidoreductase [Microscillaceae bacterium]|nr:SDR family NAD(P)-dependent oxidoreductase [Microscillaceae bacterium]MDW8461574.1 SDR family NAD(P)-dependent oxidoreductase [Cytophagales bacterium]